jgi:hypothetical protein
MKKIALLIAISIITLSSVKAQVKEKTTETSKPESIPAKQPKTYTLGLQADSAGYINIITALYTAQVLLNQSKGPHDSVNQSIEFIEEIKKLFASQKAQQDKVVKEEKPKNP